MSSPLKALLVDNHSLFVASLIRALQQEETDITVTSAASAEHALAHLSSNSAYDVILVDIRLPSLSGIQFIKCLHNLGISIPVVVMASTTHNSDYTLALSAGAQGVTTKHTSPGELLHAVQTVMRGEIYVPFGDARFHSMLSVDETDSDHVLSHSQQDILQLLAAGRTSADICDELSLSRTEYCHQLAEVLGLPDNASAVQAAIAAVRHHAL